MDAPLIGLMHDGIQNGPVGIVDLQEGSAFGEGVVFGHGYVSSLSNRSSTGSVRWLRM